MKMGNIAIMKTSTSSVVLRPSKIVGIKVTETNDLPPKQDSQVTEKPEIVEDIITDVDN